MSKKFKKGGVQLPKGSDEHCRSKQIKRQLGTPCVLMALMQGGILLHRKHQIGVFEAKTKAFCRGHKTSLNSKCVSENVCMQ